MAKTFDENLKAFIAANTNAAKLAVACAVQAITHLYETGDIVFCQRFLDAMQKNWNRTAAFKLWLRDFAPVNMENGRFIFDHARKAMLWTSPEAKTELLQIALAKPFYDYAPDKEQVAFSFDDVVTSLESVIQRFKNSNRYTADAIEANRVRLEQAERMVAALKAGNIATVLPADPSIQAVAA